MAQTAGEFDHLLIVSSLPVLLPPAVFDLEGWNEAVCDGVWGPVAAWVGERVRQAIDLEHWAAFRLSFDALMRLVADIGARVESRRPATILFLSGDVHYSYLARASFSPADAVGCPVYQAVCSPLRNPTQRSVQIADRLARTGLSQWLGRLLARSVGLPAPAVSWEVTRGPWFHNGIATLALDDRDARLAFCQAPSRPDRHGPRLDTVCVAELTASRHGSDR